MHFINFIFQSVLLPEVLINTGFEKKNEQDMQIIFSCGIDKEVITID